MKRMKNTIKITLWAILLLALTVTLAVMTCCYISGTSNNALSSKFENDSDNDGVVDSIYYYNYDIRKNQIKLGIDSDNDGAVNNIYCCNLENQRLNKPF